MTGFALLAAATTGLAVALVVGQATGATRVLTGTLARARPRRGRSDADVWLAQAGVDLTSRQFWAGSLLAGAATYTLVAVVTATPAAAVAPALAVGLLPRAWFARQRAQRLRAVAESWPDGLRELVASISAGASLHRAIVHLTEHGPEPLRQAFARYPVLARILGVVPALEAIREELADPTSDRVIAVLVLAHERGGHLVTAILRDLADATSRDVRVLEEIATDSLEQRINARAVFVLPWLVLLLLTARAGHFRDFYQSTGGLVVVAVGGILSLAGMWLVSRLSRDPVEPRVLGGPMPPVGTGKGR